MGKTASLGGYAQARTLRPDPAGSLPAAVPLLTLEGPEGVGEVLGGKLPGGIEGSVAHFTWVTRQGDDTVRRPFTVALTGVPESIAFMPRLLVRDRSNGIVNQGTFEDYATTPVRPTRLESEALADRYWLFVPETQDDRWVRQLFPPSFMDWLANGAPKGFSFELYDGALCGYVAGHLEAPPDLDALCEATAHVADRVRREALEQEGGAGTAPTTRDPIVDRFLDDVSWTEPPADAVTAVRAYRPVIRRARSSYTAPLFTGGGSGVMAVLFTDVSVGGLVVGLIVGSGVGAGTLNKVVRDRAIRVGEEAFLRGYARSRDLRHEDPRTFQARHMRLALPGVAVGVVSGALAGIGEGSLVMCSDRRDRKHRRGWQAVVAELESEPPAGIVRPPAGDALGIAVSDRTVCVYGPAPSWEKRTAADLDAFSAAAGRTLRDAVGSAAGHPA